MRPVPARTLSFWADFKDANGKSAPLNREKMEKIRRLCMTDGAFLAKTLGYNRFDPEVHKEMWDFCVQKNPDILSFEEFALQDTTTHERAGFTPRNGFKSTAWTVVDTVQYVIVWPDISILLVVGKEERGREFLEEIQLHFKLTSEGKIREVDGKFSLFQMAFPEFCIAHNAPKDSFTCPCRTATEGARQATVSFAGVETSMSGPHFDVMKFDDAVTNENTKTPMRLISIRNQIGFHRKMMNPYGYCDFIGTWYNPQDHYGYIIKAENDNKTLEWNKGRADSRDINGREMLTRIMLRPAMWPKGDKILPFDGEMNKDDWELWFPKRITWKWLMGELGQNPDLFHSQMMNNPNLAKSVRFNRSTMVNQTIPYNTLPDMNGGVPGVIVQAWDTAYTGNPGSDYTVGLTMFITAGRFFLVDMVRGQYGDFDLPRVMAESMNKWRPVRVVLEDANGIPWLRREVNRELHQRNFYVPIELCDSVQNTKNKKSVMAAPVVKLFGDRRIVISNGVPFLDAFYTELEGFQNGAANDDIVDALSLLIYYFQYIPEASHYALVPDMKESIQRARERMQYDHIFYGGGTGDMGFEPTSEGQSREEIPSWVTYSPMDPFKQ